MQLGFHFGFKKSKAYGLCGVMLAILFLGMSGHSAKADEMLSPTDTSSTLKESTENHEASYSEVGVHDNSTSQMNLQSEKVLEEEQTSLADSSKIAVLTNSSVTTSSYQEADELSEIDQNQSHFLSAIKQGAMDGAKEGVLPSITAAQAILESGWGSSELAKAPNNNLFGIKDSEDWNGEIVTVPTQEYVNGDYITVNAAFRKYTSWNDSVVDHAKFFTSTEWRKNNYRKVVNETDYRVAAQELKNAGYATDPSYPGKLISLIEAYKLYEWDAVSNTTNSVLENEGVESQDPKADLAITGLNNATGSYDLVISNLVAPRGFKEVLVPTWSEKNGQDDIIWYKAAKQANGAYKVTISASQHKWNSGKYIVHGYIVDASGKNIGFGATSADVVAPKKIGSASSGNYDVLNKIVYLDAGHGGYDPGASYFGISEKSLTLAIQSRVKAKLEAEGYQVVTTRTSDTYVDLTDRSRAANASESDIFVSIHINASGSSAAQGIETYYYQPYAEYPSRINATYHANSTRLSMSDTLANAIQSSLINATGAQNQGVKRQTFAVLRETTAPAVLLELGFLSNPQEAARLNTSAYQETLANAIVAGIKSYYEKESKV